jgi:uncharacterized protein
VRFWDTSALIPILLDEDRSTIALSFMRTDSNVVVSFLTLVEIDSTLARRQASAQQRRDALELYASLRSIWTVIDDYKAIVHEARRVAQTHALRSGDAVQLASAVIGCRPKGLIPFVCFDDELNAAAFAEGFPLLG